MRRFSGTPAPRQPNAPPTNTKAAKPVRPVDAAGLILIRERGDKPEVLLGRRLGTLRFMPGFYVFPGGRVDFVDRKKSGFQERVNPPPGGVDEATRRRLSTFARTALRESYEETGLLLESKDRDAAEHPSSVARPGTDVWQAYRRAQTTPAFEALRLVARAITPTESPIRFHTRFFAADGDLARGELSGDGELEDLNWVRYEDTQKLKISEVTLFVLREALAHRAMPDHKRPAALFRWIGGKQKPRFSGGGKAGRA